MKRTRTHYTIVVGDFSAKVGTKQSGEQAFGNYGVGHRNNRGEMLVQFAERNRLRIMNTYFKKRKNRKWTWKSLNGEKKNEIDFIMCEKPGIIGDTEVGGKIKCSDKRLVRAKVVLNLKKVRTKLVARNRANLAVIKEKNKLKVALKNRFDALDENNQDLE